jgi:hypothetical protein
MKVCPRVGQVLPKLSFLKGFRPGRGLFLPVEDSGGPERGRRPSYRVGIRYTFRNNREGSTSTNEFGFSKRAIYVGDALPKPAVNELLMTPWSDAIATPK